MARIPSQACGPLAFGSITPSAAPGDWQDYPLGEILPIPALVAPQVYLSHRCQESPFFLFSTRQPQRGPNLKCRQETALRFMTWCFALYSLLDAPVTPGDRVSSLVRAVAVFATRIEANIDYALSQRNNHYTRVSTGKTLARARVRPTRSLSNTIGQEYAPGTESSENKLVIGS